MTYKILSFKTFAWFTGSASDNTTVVQPKTVEAQTKTNEDQDNLMDGQNKTIRCYVSQGPISKDDLTDFFADPKNQKDCAENITQCQHTIGKWCNLTQKLYFNCKDRD